MVIETGRTLTATLTFTDDADAPLDLTGITLRVEIYKGKKLQRTLTDGDGFTVVANELLFDFDIIYPAGCEYNYMVIATDGPYGAETTYMKGIWEIV